jgi:UDP-N-acetylmuramate dehydrogenase
MTERAVGNGPTRGSARSVEALADRLAAAAAMLGSRAHPEASFGARTTYRVGGTARLGVRIDGVGDLVVVADVVAACAVPVIVLGKGSNTLVADRGYDGLLIWMGDWAATVEFAGTEVRAGGATSLPVLARRTAAESLTGLEWAVGVPGSVGGAVRMNAGGHGSDIATTVDSVRVFDLTTGHDVVMSRPDLGLGFRRSALRDVDVVVDATFGLRRGDRVRSEAEIAEIVRWRREHQPGGQNAGSVFVNPVPETAGALIDAAGLRGLRLRTAEVSMKHANFIQSDEGGSADDVAALMQVVRERVEATSGHRLRSEIRMIGFDETRESEQP